MTCNTSAVAVCCSKASCVSVRSRAFSIAMTACAAKFCSSAICFSVNGANFLAVDPDPAREVLLPAQCDCYATSYAADINHLPKAYARPVSVVFQRVGVVNEPLTAHKSFARTAWGGAKSVALPHPLDIPRVTAHRHVLNVFPVIGVKMSVSGFAKPHRLFEHRVEHRDEIAGRRIDDLQYLSGRGLLPQCLTRLSQEPRVLHRNDRLRREVLQQCDLLFGEGVNLEAISSFARSSTDQKGRKAGPRRSCGPLIRVRRWPTRLGCRNGS